MENKESNTVLETPTETATVGQQINSADLLAKQQEEQKQNIAKLVEEEIEKRLTERLDSERAKVEQAKLILEEAKKNEELEKELLANERYNRIDSWRHNKIREFEEAVDVLAKLGNEKRHYADMYERYEEFKRRAASGDQRAINSLGYIEMTYAAMKVGGKEMANILFRNIGIDPKVARGNAG